MVQVKITIVGNGETPIYDRTFENMGEAKKDISLQIPQIQDLKMGIQTVDAYQINVTDLEAKETPPETPTETPKETSTATTTKKKG